MNRITNNELYNLDYTLAKIICKYLKAFKKLKRKTHPVDITRKEWEQELNFMIKTFEKIIRNFEKDAENNIKIEEGLFLFAGRFLELWD